MVLSNHVASTLPETDSSPLKMDGGNTTFLLGSRPIFMCVSFREGKGLEYFQIILPLPLPPPENEIKSEGGFRETLANSCRIISVQKNRYPER